MNLNEGDLLSAATAEKIALIERLRAYFDETSRQSLLARSAVKKLDSKMNELQQVTLYNLYSIIWQCLQAQRDMSVVRHLNRELLGNIITQQCAIYQFKLEETKVNLYGEAAEEKFYDGPFLFNVLINRSNEEFGENEEGVQYSQPIEFYFLRDDLTEKKVDLEVGDIILYQEGYYGVQSTNANQYWGGKNPSYPNNSSNGEPNPLNPGLDKFGNNISILASTYYIQSDKVAISPYRERF